MSVEPLLWTADGIVHGESGAFLENCETRPAFPVAEMLRVWNSTLGVEFEPGLDFLFHPESGLLERLPGSRMALLSHDDLYPPPGKAVYYPAEHANAVSNGSGGEAVRYDAMDFFARHQFEMEYRTNAKLPAFRTLPGNSLAGRAFRLVFIGDSITEGCNATGVIHVPPYAPPYPEQVATALRTAGAEVEMHNLAVGGTGCEHGLQHLPSWLENVVPDILVIAYGMNDLRSFTPEEFARRIAALADLALQRNPAAKILTVAPMPGNAAWECTPPAVSRAFSAALRQLPFPCADVNHFWEEILGGKNFFEITGNGVNHPNDYGQRLYAAVVEDRLAQMLTTT